MSYFTGSAWQYDELTGEYYLRLYASTQPDLNWESEACRNAIYKYALKYWFDKGIDGFRIDTARLYSKVQTFPDAPIVFPESEWQPCAMYTSNGPRVHEFHKEMVEKVTSHYDVMTVGEVGDCSREDALKYVSAKEKEMNMLFLFDLVNLGITKGKRFKMTKFTLKDFKAMIEKQCDFITGTDAWTTVYIENHDQPRCVSRFGSTKSLEDTFKSAKMIAMLQTCLTGTLYIYQGQEISMTNFPRSWPITEYLDIATLNSYKQLCKENNITDPDNDERVQEFMDAAAMVARDHSRTPVQWDSSDYGGFSTAKPWMRINDNYKEINAESQINNSDSVFNFYKTLLKLRKQYKELLIYGDFNILDFDNQEVFTFLKKSGNSKIYVVLNFSDVPSRFEKLIDDDIILLQANVEHVNYHELSPWEGRIYLVS